jgi:hypothetical protein
LLDGPLNRPTDFEVHAAKQFTFYDGLRLNSWFRCKTAAVVGPPRQSIALVEQDFNSPIEEAEKRDFDAGQRREFFGRVPAGLREVLDLYFPETETTQCSNQPQAAQG